MVGLLEGGIIGGLMADWGLKKKALIKKMWRVDSMDDEEKHEVVAHWIENFPGLRDDWEDATPEQRVEIYRECLRLTDKAMRAEPPGITEI
jgi:predicted Fe-S protein YdhL (DUF1289 family)